MIHVSFVAALIVVSMGPHQRFPTIDDLHRYLQSVGPNPKREREVDAALRQGVREHPGDADFEYEIGAWLFYVKRVDEAFPYLSRVCEKTGSEKACAAASGTSVARGRWSEAERLASRFTETACAKSDRLWVLKNLLRDTKGSVTRTEGLLRVEPEHEMTYLLRAASLELTGDHVGAGRAIDEGRVKARAVILLDAVTWSGRTAPRTRAASSK